MKTRITSYGWLVFLLSIGWQMGMVGCQDGEGTGGTNDASQATEAQNALLLSLVEHVYRPTVNEFQDAARSLETAISEWNEIPSLTTLAAARDAWLRANLLWQKAEVMQVGPAGLANRRIAGADLRELIYSYPARSPCRIDQELVIEAYEDAAWFDSALSNVQGLDAIEYLLHSVDEATQCPDAALIIREGSWRALAANMEDLSGRRRRMAKVLAKGVAQHGESLASAWKEGGAFTQAFLAGTSPFSGAQQVINESYAGLFYVEKVVKDLKLGKLTETAHGCEAGTCPDALESKFAHVSKENIRANLEGFRFVYRGGDGPSSFGFDQLLRSEGADELADSMLERIDEAIDAIDALDRPLYEHLEDAPDMVRNVYDKVKALTDLFKGHFVTVLNLEIPLEGAGDAD